MTNIHRFIRNHEVFKNLVVEKVFKRNGYRLAAYVDLISYADDNGMLKVSTKDIKEIWKYWGFTHKTTYQYFIELIAVELLKVVSKESRKGEWLLTIPEIYRNIRGENSGINKISPEPRQQPRIKNHARRKEQITIDDGKHKSSVNFALDGSSSGVEVIVNNQDDFTPPSKPQKPVGSPDDLFTGSSTDFPTDNLLISGGSKRGEEREERILVLRR